MNAKAWRLAASMAALCGAFGVSQASAAVAVSVLSSMPQLVTGGDALVKVSGVTSAPAITVEGRDISAAFKTDSSGNYIGLVSGLKDGSNSLVVKSGTDQASVTLVNHGINDTLFAGPQQTPYLCENDSFGLAPATDASCAAPTVVSYFYMSKTGDWKPFDPNGARPGDIAITMTSDGKNVPEIVRQEKGVINRAAYYINVLQDPAAGPAPTPISRGGSAWNGKLIYGFGPGVGAGYHMGRNIGLGAVATQFIDPTDVGLGYATATSSLNVFGNQPSDVLSAETAEKVKEHFIEEFGPPLYTAGQGGSGGGMQQQLISNSYPGILDAIMPQQVFADEMTFLQPLYDCELLVNAFKQGTWTRDQMNAVSGMYWGYCVSNGTRYPRAQVDQCDTAVADLISKDPALKAKPPRCSFQDNLAEVFGTDPKTGFARNPFDNQGVQYGLVALNSGAINMDQFIDINKRIGGQDVNGKLSPNRQVGDDQAIKAAYATGRINEVAGGGNAVVPYIDTRTYADGDPFGRGDPNVDVHAGYHSYVLQARFQKYVGNMNNYVYLLAATAPAIPNNAFPTPATVAVADRLSIMDRWMTAILADTSNKTQAQKVAADRPKDVVNTCYAAAGGANLAAIEKITDWNKCQQIFPTTTDPRIAAGAPMTDDVFKCQLKPVDPADYKTAATADQLAQLKQIYPAGVCDYTKPGVGQGTKLVTWASFKGDGTFVGL